MHILSRQVKTLPAFPRQHNRPMHLKAIIPLATILLSFSLCSVSAQDRRKKAGGFAYPPAIAGATVEAYKKIGETELNLWILQPKKSDELRPAIVFFFGGGWSSGSPEQFERQARHFAERGMVAITADYRVASRQKAKPVQCVADAKSCIRWVRANAQRLGIDPQRIVAAGGSAGGHLAAATATLPGLDEASEDAKVSSQPNALVLFNPCVVTAPVSGLDFKGFASNSTLEKVGCEPESLSPIHHVKEGLPPTLIMHGKSDTTVPYVTVEAFTERMKKAGNRCELKGYDGQQHGFFNGPGFTDTLAAADEFLVSLKYLPAK